MSPANDDRPLIGITMGDPSGIGSEVVAKALANPAVYEHARPFVIGTVAGMKSAAQIAGTGARVTRIDAPAEASAAAGVIEVFSPGDWEGAEFPAGKHSVDSGRASHEWVETAAKLCLDGSLAAMVTAPVNKESWHMSGSADVGHQEVFKRLTGSDYVATMLVSGTLRCMHLSTHKPLAEACAYVTRANVLRAIRLTDKHFREWGFEKPRIAVAALNPHASDNGLIGHEEHDEIAPAIGGAKQAGINATGPHPADSVFNNAIAGRHDVVVVMYHDQGHIPIKVHGFEESISVNLGIPFIRTSVDHGTAFDIVGQNKADATSMYEAIKVASDLAGKRGLGG